ncbi:MAG: hypothetical protein KF764_23840 [Labilithrix sp.]|nr:hypothetical protein [Labilithrix sp.]
MSSLETSVTLDDVFTVVEAKRVPLAPELAGYLTLEVADGTDAGSGDVDPKTVFISEEGTVALVRPKKDAVTGDAEASVRALLAKLLDASGSGTPALTTAAKRKPGNGLPALVEELEAALIPVNRAAGRRALARLAREVKRVLLGVGRNASVPPVQNRPDAKAAAGAPPHARPALRKRDDDRPSDPKLPKSADVSANLAHGEVAVRRIGSFDDEAATAKRANQLSELASSMNAVEGDPAEDAKAEAAKPETPKAAPRAPAGASPRPPPAVLPPPPVKAGSAPPGPPLAPPPPRRTGDDKREGAAAPVIAEVKVDGPGPTLFGGDEVDSLLDSFGVSSAHEDKQMARELKAIAGLSPTPPPPDAKTLAELTKDVGKDLPKKLDSSIDGDSVEALLALADMSAPINAPIAAKNDAVPPVAPAPVAAPPPAANLPPSPLFGGAGASASTAAAAAGAPVALRQSAEADAPLPPPAPVPEAPRAEAAPLRQPDPPRFDPPKAKAPAASPTASGARAKADAPPSTTSQPGVKRSRSSSGGQRPRAPRTGMAMLVFALVVLAGGTAAVWKFAPQVFTGKKKPSASSSTTPTATTPPAPKCKVALVLTDVPANAEILLRVGQAPVDVERMPVGTRLELVATAEGYAPRRAVIKGESPWDKGPDGKPRIEVPIQLDPTKSKPGAIDPWPAAEPGSQVGGSGAPGTVHVVSNVRGAEVWLLAGLGPEARIDQLRCDADIDVLLAGPPALRKRLHVGEKDITATEADAAGNKVVNLSAKEATK